MKCIFCEKELDGHEVWDTFLGRNTVLCPEAEGILITYPDKSGGCMYVKRATMEVIDEDVLLKRRKTYLPRVIWREVPDERLGNNYYPIYATYYKNLIVLNLTFSNLRGMKLFRTLLHEIIHWVIRRHRLPNIFNRFMDYPEMLVQTNWLIWFTDSDKYWRKTLDLKPDEPVLFPKWY